MKLHSIETLNLNSLYGEQRVDFDADLRGASLFLIQGPTGAGKSTLMDAVSLALFGQTPRLTGKGKSVGEGVMSRGTGKARAAVCFSKLEFGTRVYYRAVWLVRRAREKPDGNLQQPVRSLERLRSGGDRSADKDWKTLVSSHKAAAFAPHFDDALERFGPEDFQRTMLLAQGKFDALIEAKPQHRASILERLTQTGDYKRLGERASQVASAWRTRLGELEVAARSQTSLSAEQIDAARAQAEAQAAELTRLDGERARLDTGLRWLEADAAQAQAVRDATAALEEARAAQRELAASVAALAEHERCADAFAALDARDAQRKQLREAKGRLQRARDLLPRRREDEAARRETLAGVSAAADNAEGAERALQPTLNAAEAATGALELAREELRKATDVAARARRRQQEAVAAEATVAEQVTQLQSRAAQAERRLAELAQHEPLAAALPPLRERVAGLHEADRALREADDALAQQRANLRREAALVAREHEVHEAAVDAKLRPLRERRAAARAALAVLAPDAAAAEALAREHDAAREGQLRRREAGQAAARLATQAQRDAAAAAAAARSLAEAEAAARASAEAHATAVQALSGAQGALAEVAALRAPHARYLALRDARAELAEGEACPLCGSEEHPDGHGERAAAKTEAAEAALVAADRREAEAQAALARAQAGATAAQAALTRAQTTVGLRQEQRDAAAAQATQSAAALWDALQGPELAAWADAEGVVPAASMASAGVAETEAAVAAAVDDGDADAGDANAGDADAGDVDAGDVDSEGVDSEGVNVGDVDAAAGALATLVQGCAEAAEAARVAREALTGALAALRHAEGALTEAEQAFAAESARLNQRDAALAERDRQRGERARAVLAQGRGLAVRCEEARRALAALRDAGAANGTGDEATRRLAAEAGSGDARAEGREHGARDGARGEARDERDGETGDARLDLELERARDAVTRGLDAVDAALQQATAEATAWQDAQKGHADVTRALSEALVRQQAAAETRASASRAASEADQALTERQNHRAKADADVVSCRRALREAWHVAAAHDGQWAASADEVRARMAAQGGVTTHADRDAHRARPAADQPLRVLASWQRALVAALQGLAQDARERHSGAQQALVACQTQVSTLTERVGELTTLEAEAQSVLDAALATLAAAGDAPSDVDRDVDEGEQAAARAARAEQAAAWGPLDEVGLHNRRLRPAEVREIRAEEQRLSREVATAEGRVVSAGEALSAHRSARPAVITALAADLAARGADSGEGEARPADPADQDAGAVPRVSADPTSVSAVNTDSLSRALRQAASEVAQRRAEVAEQLREAQGVLAVAAKEAQQLAAAQATLSAARAKAKVWLHLHELIGVGDGDAFKRFAQALNLGQLLRQANVHLRALKGRYRFAVVRDEETGLPTLDFEVEDRWQPGVRRGLKTLSGGETFLASLALALGLSDLRTTTMPVDTLLLDEGFGTLDPDTLDDALQALQALQASGRQVGIISHVVGLQERIQARIRVEPLGEGRSRVVVG